MSDDNHFPPQTKFILGNEACERFSYYGMRSILAVYITAPLVLAAGVSGSFPGLGMSADAATITIHAFIFACYATGVLGGWIADRLWGRFKTILWISLLYCLGHGVLALSDLSASTSYKIACLYVGLTFIALGSGGIKPCVSAFMGDQFNAGQSRLLEKAYSAFYWCINLGSFLSMLLIPWVRTQYGYGWAFGIPGIFMALATLVFWFGRHRYVHAPLATGPGFWQITFFAFRSSGLRSLDTFWNAARGRFGENKVEEVIATLRAVRLFVLIPPFWALYDQNTSTWVLQGKRMTPLDLGFVTFDAEQMQAANPALIMVLVPLLTLVFYPLIGKLATPLRRMTLGMVLAALSFVVVGWLQQRIEGGETLSLAWQLAPYVVLTAGEVLVSVTGLELSYTQAPKSMKSTVGSFWLLTVAAGQLIVMGVTHLGSEAGREDTAVTSGRFFLYAGLLAVTAVVFAVVAQFHQNAVRDKGQAV
ncbi:MAG: oligopeptide:H+ symporter [Puniceicoccales bacterium]|jgi:POT family proton-dependent oligopeptide transporter|nr:oligopeptide:H+ symporter [Puniceicoccales bacterium]